jgi:hypothetical protein
MCADATSSSIGEGDWLVRVTSALLRALGDAERTREAWQDLAVTLAGHLEDEERDWILAVARVSPRDARALRAEHAHLRTRVAALGEALGGGASIDGDLRGFVDELLAHARHEDALLVKLPLPAP